jgi:hypothetical protein
MMYRDIHINILPDESELRIFIEELALMTPQEIADVVEQIVELLRTLPSKPLMQMSVHDPALLWSPWQASPHEDDDY